MSREQSRLRRVTPHALSNNSTSLPESVSGPALLVVIQWLIHGGADRATLELLQGIKRLAPEVRCYLVTTVPAKMEWVDEVHQAVDAVFSLPDMARVEAEKRLAQLVEQLDVNCVLVVNSMLGYNALPHIDRSGREVRVVSQIHGFMRDPLTEDFVGHSVYAATRFDHLIDGYAVISRFVADQLINRFGVSADKIRVMYCGIDLNRFRAARRQRFPPGRSARILWLGRLSWEKDPVMAVRVARTWKELHGSQRIEFRLVGSGELYDEVEQWIREEELDDIVSLSPAIDDPISLYEWADCLMVTSRYEGIPFVIYQAMSAGLPVVTPIRNTSIPEILARDDAYFVEQQNSPAEYVTAIRRVSDRPDEVRFKVERAALAVSPYAHNRHIGEMLKFLFPNNTGTNSRSQY
jgi:glycosyltransferase involved in cell wall biosynthesis